MMYRIEWISKTTGATGQGTGTFSKDEAIKIVKELNRSEAGEYCIHYIVPADKTKDDDKGELNDVS